MHTFNDDDDEYAHTESSADDILEEIEEQEAEQEAEEDAVDTVLSNAIERIEEANVWKLLISQDVITPGSASGRVVKSVNSQLKKFGLNRLEILLGMKDAQVANPVQIIQQFDPEETKMLRVLAAKMLGRSVASVISTPTSESAPKLNTVSIQEERIEPRLQKISAPPAHKINSPKVQRNRDKTTEERLGTQLKPNRLPKRTNVPENAKVDQGYALPNSTGKAKPMPTMQQQMAIYGMGATQPMNVSVDRSAKGGDTNKGASVLSQVIGQLTGGHTIAVDTSAPDGAGENINERF